MHYDSQKRFKVKYFVELFVCIDDDLIFGVDYDDVFLPLLDHLYDEGFLFGSRAQIGKKRSGCLS